MGCDIATPGLPVTSLSLLGPRFSHTVLEPLPRVSSDSQMVIIPGEAICTVQTICTVLRPQCGVGDALPDWRQEGRSQSFGFVALIDI